MILVQYLSRVLCRPFQSMCFSFLEFSYSWTSIHVRGLHCNTSTSAIMTFRVGLKLKGVPRKHSSTCHECLTEHIHLQITSCWSWTINATGYLSRPNLIIRHEVSQRRIRHTWMSDSRSLVALPEMLEGTLRSQVHARRRVPKVMARR